MKNVLFSIVIPTHNRPDFLERSMGSIWKQAFQDWELIIVDDGSDSVNNQDNKKLLGADSDDRIRYVYQDTAGPGAARKRGVEMARGRYFMLLDDDDYFLPNHLANVADWLTKHEYPAFVLNTGLVSEYSAGKRIEHPALARYALQDPLLEFWQSPRNLTAFIFPRQVTDLVPIDANERVIEDFGWLARVLIHFPLRALAGYTAVYVHHSQNRNNTLIDADWLSGRIRVVNSAYDYTGTEVRVPKRVKNDLLCHQCWHYARQCWGVGEWRQGMQGFIRGFDFVGWGNVRELGYTAYYLLKQSSISILSRSVKS